MKKASLSRVVAEEPGEGGLGASDTPVTTATAADAAASAPTTTAATSGSSSGSSSGRATDAALFDRVISIEMLEHMKNYQKLLAKVSSWLRPGGKLFVHIFTHATTAYHFDKSWMAENFFTGGRCQGKLLIEPSISLHFPLPAFSLCFMWDRPDAVTGPPPLLPARLED